MGSGEDLGGETVELIDGGFVGGKTYVQDPGYREAGEVTDGRAAIVLFHHNSTQGEIVEMPRWSVPFTASGA